MADEIGAKIVLSAEDRNASSTLKTVAGEVKGLTTTTDAARAASGRFADGQQAAQGAVAATGNGIGALQGNLVQLAGALPGVGGVLQSVIGGTSSAFGHLSGVASAAASGPLAAVTAGIGAVAAVAGVAEQALDSFANKQDRVTALDAALAQNGLLTEANRQKYQALAAELGKATGQGGAFLNVLAQLVKFGADDSNITEYAGAVKNLAGLLGGDVDRASQVWVRAMNGNYTALTRLGIEVDKSKDKHTQLDDVMAQLAQRGGGQLEAQTHTLHGQFRALAGAVGGLFSGLGNLLSQTGLVQAGVGALTTVVRAFGSILPKTVEQVDGLTNRLPPLKDEFGNVKGAAEEMGDEMGGVAGSADSAAAGLGRAGEAATKTKEKFDQAVEAAKKLRQEQDAMADAQTALKLAQVDADEAKKLAAPGADKDAVTLAANRQRAQIRVDGEQAAIGRKVEEQNTLAQAAIDQRYAAQQRADEQRRSLRPKEAAFGLDASAAGLTGGEAEELAVKSERDGKDYFGDLAKSRRRDSANARSAADALDSGEDADPVAAQKSREEATAADLEASALDGLSKKFLDLREARKDATIATQKYAQAVATAQTVIDATNVEKTRLGIVQQTDTTKAATERAKVEADEKKKAAEQAEQLRQTELKRLEEELKRPGNTDARRQQVVDARRGLEGESDRYVDRDVTPGQRRQNEALRRTQRAERDARDTGGGDAIVGDVTKLSGVLPAGAPGSLSGQAKKLIEQIIKNGGKDSKQDNDLVGVLQHLAENVRQQGGKDAAIEAAIRQLRTDLEAQKRVGRNS